MKTIDTAPRDGTKIKLCAFEDGKAVMCLEGAWDGEVWKITRGGEWSERDGCGPTHWEATR